MSINSTDRAFESAIGRLAELTSDRPADVTDRILGLARDYLRMDAAFLTEFRADDQFFNAADGEDPASFGLSVGCSLARADSYCEVMIRGSLPWMVIEDAKNDPRVSELPTTSASDIGGYVGVPVRYPDGTSHGTLCCLSHETLPEVKKRDVDFMRLLAQMLADEMERDELERKNRNLEIQAVGVQALLTSLAERDGYTEEHSREVTELALRLGERLGMNEEELTELRQVSMLHDIGKMGIPDAILNKPAALDETEWELMKEHTLMGERMLKKVAGLAHLAPAVRSEHERWDGNGYPDGIGGDAIPLASRIILVCDAYHAMISDRPYRPPMSQAAAVEELSAQADRQFEGRIVRELLNVLGEEELLESRPT